VLLWVLLCVCLRVLGCRFSAGLSMLLSNTSWSVLSFGGPLAVFPVTEPLFGFSGIARGCSIWGQLHWLSGEEKTNICSRQAMEIQTAVTLMPKDKPETPLSSPLSFAEQGILLVEIKCVDHDLSNIRINNNSLWLRWHTYAHKNLALHISQICFLINKETFYLCWNLMPLGVIKALKAMKSFIDLIKKYKS